MFVFPHFMILPLRWERMTSLWDNNQDAGMCVNLEVWLPTVITKLHLNVKEFSLIKTNVIINCRMKML